MLDESRKTVSLQPHLLGHVLLEPAGERVLVGRELGKDRAAVGPPDMPLLGEQGEVAASGHRRHAEPLLHVGDGQAAARPEQFDDLPPPLCRDEVTRSVRQ